MSSELFSKYAHNKRLLLAKLITALESKNVPQRLEALSFLESHPPTQSTMRIGITGVPGAGKSTLIEHLGLMFVEDEKHIAVLTIDPSSPTSGGSLLGDRIRMERLSGHPHAFIRSTPSGHHHGGVSRRTFETILACESVGYDVIVIESLGVGQGEYELKMMVDLLLLLHLPGGGDDIQGMKKGLLELADMIAITKSDGALKELSALAKSYLMETSKLHADAIMTVSKDDVETLHALKHSIETFFVKKGTNNHAGPRQQQLSLWCQRELEWAALDAIKQLFATMKPPTQSEKNTQIIPSLWAYKTLSTLWNLQGLQSVPMFNS